MKILVLSDTHIPLTSRTLPPAVTEEARRCDICLHAGDFVSYDTYKMISGMIETHAVCGNMDDQEIIDKLPDKKIIHIDGMTIGLTHGRGAPNAVIASVDKIFSDQHQSIDIFVFGHSHVATNEEINKKIYFNPGSPTDTIFALRRSYGILEIRNKKIARKVVYLD